MLTRELGHFPLTPELRIKARSDANFPSHSVWTRLGKKKERRLKLLEFCKHNSCHEDVIPLLDQSLNETNDDENTEYENQSKGYVYLVRHGNRNEYKIGCTNNPIRREGEISIELPDKMLPVHWIETDDPYGIEKYWHSRFAKKRKNGEWFNLSGEDVRAFKRWKRIY